MSMPISQDYSYDLNDSVSFYLAEVAFKFIILVLCMAISSHIIHGFGTAKAKKTFMGLFFLTLIIVQYYYIIQASKHIPVNRFYTYREGVILRSCKASTKGGKAAAGLIVPENVNPCFTSCIDSSYGKCLDWNGTEIHYNTAPLYLTSCPLRNTTSCVANNGTEIESTVPTTRDCQGGFGTKCSMAQPCQPCELSYIREHKVSRCRQCSSVNDGNCNFEEGVGPYCYVSPTSKAVEPCRKCCTEPTPVVVDGVCY